MAWKLLYGPGTPAGRRAEDQQIVRRTRCSGRGRRGQLTGAASFDITGRLAEIRIPTLVMHGAQDRNVPAANAQRLADGIAGARLVMFPDAGHAYITDVAQAANQEVLRFLAGISGPADASSTGTRPATSTAETPRRPGPVSWSGWNAWLRCSRAAGPGMAFKLIESAQDREVTSDSRDEVDVRAVDPGNVRRDYAECACHGQGRSSAGGHGAVGPRDHQP
jgi:hypothetical protein